MKQHPVPQHISSYEFHLIGDMTLKQFGFLVAGGLAAFLFYLLKVNFLIKTIGIVSGLTLGAGFAFLSFQERPLDRWVTSFFKAIYSPTQYLWKKSKKIPDYFQATPPSFSKIQETLFQGKPKQKISLTEYLQSLPPSHLSSPVEKAESLKLQKIGQLLQTPISSFGPLPQSPPPEIQKEGLKIHPLTQKSQIKELKLPVKAHPPSTQPPKKTKKLPSLKPTKTQVKIHPLTQKSKKPTVEAVLKPSLPMLEKPTSPNIIFGMIKDKNGKLVENAILEIQDQKGIPQRAFKTNKLGQFRIATPLKNGTYSILVEKDDLVFDIIKITLNGKIVPPIEIQAK